MNLSCPCCKKNNCTKELVELATKLLEWLVHQGIDAKVTSGYRCEKHQKELLESWSAAKAKWDIDFPGKKFPFPKPAERSPHCQGIAIDIICPPGTERTVSESAQAMGFTGIGIGQGLVHADLGPRREWRY